MLITSLVTGIEACRLVDYRHYFVPSHQSTSADQIQILQDFIDNSQKLAVITGAGISTESGIPDYRSEGVGLYARNGYRPINYLQFLSHHSIRQRYWARSFLSWNNFFQKKPNEGHLTLRRWETAGRLEGCVTQNVDRLHHKAGSEKIIELHGSLYSVRCIQCHHMTHRTLFQTILADLNADLIQTEEIGRVLSSDYQKLARPDGDIDVNSDLVNNFQIPYCQRCDGILKPDIVFFGDNVSSKLVNRIYTLIDHCDSLLVLGSSLQVYSSYRFVLRANKANKPIVIVNIGPTRADSLENIVRLNAKIGHVLPLIKV